MSAKWNVLQICGAGEGAQWFIDQVRELRERGHNIGIIVPNAGSVYKTLTAERFEVEVIPFRGFKPRDWIRLARAQTKLAHRLNDPTLDIVHAHLLKAVVASRLAIRNSNRPALVSQMPGIVHLESRALKAIDRATMRWDSALVASCN